MVWHGELLQVPNMKRRVDVGGDHRTGKGGDDGLGRIVLTVPTAAWHYLVIPSRYEQSREHGRRGIICVHSRRFTVRRIDS